MSLGVSERASEQISAVERAIKASHVEQANEVTVRVNEQTDERVAQYLCHNFFCSGTSRLLLVQG